VLVYAVIAAWTNATLATQHGTFAEFRSEAICECEEC
jgi:hypothetical protein